MCETDMMGARDCAPANYAQAAKAMSAIVPVMVFMVIPAALA